MVHIVTVNEQTFKYHLEYMFCGTGKNESEHQIGALIDMSVVTVSDIVIFYVEKNGFYGFFEVVGLPYFSPLNENFLKAELGRSLSYRFKICPSEKLGLYKYSKSEWEAIENPINFDYKLKDMQWSWIFKKLKGNRGLLSIPEDESIKLIDIIIKENEKLIISNDPKVISFDKETKSIVLSNSTNDAHFTVNKSKILYLQSDQDNNFISIKDTNLVGNSHKNNFSELGLINLENDLRRYLCFSLVHKESFKDFFEIEGKINYLGNEVVSSFSETRMDIVVNTTSNYCYLLELKKDFIFDNSIMFQMEKYSRWISAYKSFEAIYPILILKKPKDISSSIRNKNCKYLSETDKMNNSYSPWYQNIIFELQKCKKHLEKKSIENLLNFKVFLFDVDEKKFLINIEKLDFDKER